MGVAAVRAALGRQLNSVGLHHVVDILDRGKSTGDVYPVVVAAQQKVAVEVELLQVAVAGELDGKSRLQSIPALAVILDRIDLVDAEIGQRHQERGGQISPQRV